MSSPADDRLISASRIKLVMNDYLNRNIMTLIDQKKEQLKTFTGYYNAEKLSKSRPKLVGSGANSSVTEDQIVAAKAVVAAGAPAAYTQIKEEKQALNRIKFKFNNDRSIRLAAYYEFIVRELLLNAFANIAASQKKLVEPGHLLAGADKLNCWPVIGTLGLWHKLAGASLPVATGGPLATSVDALPANEEVLSIMSPKKCFLAYIKKISDDITRPILSSTSVPQEGKPAKKLNVHAQHVVFGTFKIKTETKQFLSELLFAISARLANNIIMLRHPIITSHSVSEEVLDACMASFINQEDSSSFEIEVDAVETNKYKETAVKLGISLSGKVFYKARAKFAQGRADAVLAFVNDTERHNFKTLEALGAQYQLEPPRATDEERAAKKADKADKAKKRADAAAEKALTNAPVNAVATVATTNVVATANAVQASVKQALLTATKPIVASVGSTIVAPITQAVAVVQQSAPVKKARAPAKK
jgi:hypothetical protein